MPFSICDFRFAIVKPSAEVHNPKNPQSKIQNPKCVAPPAPGFAEMLRFTGAHSKEIKRLRRESEFCGAAAG